MTRKTVLFRYVIQEILELIEKITLYFDFQMFVHVHTNYSEKVQNHEINNIQIELSIMFVHGTYQFS
mgnify:CR=1 FL=1